MYATSSTHSRHILTLGMGLIRQAKPKRWRQTGVCRRLRSAELCHAPCPETGTAWDGQFGDYAYTRELDGAGWAWEFLRRNEDYCVDFRTNRAGHPVPSCMSVAPRFTDLAEIFAAEVWGLSLFADPEKSALDQDIFWHPTVKNIRDPVPAVA